MSICKKICKVDDNNTFCVGCGRTLEEITEWFYASQERKMEIAVSAKNRIKKLKADPFPTVMELDYHYRDYDND
jgi:predicted Fe-S protein YdhL (DUF1289 family)